jgi:hypothetical protein
LKQDDNDNLRSEWQREHREKRQKGYHWISRDIMGEINSIGGNSLDNDSDSDY